MLRGEKHVVMAGLLCAMMVMGAAGVEMPAAVKTIAGRLEKEQIKEGVQAGAWDKAAGFNAPIVSGLVDAYLYTKDPTYKQCAELGGEFIVSNAAGAYMGDEIYALARLSESEDDSWSVIVKEFYDQVLSYPGGIPEYAGLYGSIDPSAAVFYLAHLTVAAQDTNAQQVERWRAALIDALAKVNDATASYPVMALGVATWALAQTGDLDETPVSEEPGSYWDGVRLQDLGALLAGHQVPQGKAFSGSFYWRFDHAPSVDGLAAGYTEDTIYGTLGLLAVARLAGSVRVDNEGLRIRAAADMLLGGVDAEGVVYEHLLQMGVIHYAFAGEMLQVLHEIDAYLKPGVTVAGDGAGDKE